MEETSADRSRAEKMHRRAQAAEGLYHSVVGHIEGWLKVLSTNDPIDAYLFGCALQDMQRVKRKAEAELGDGAGYWTSPDLLAAFEGRAQAFAAAAALRRVSRVASGHAGPSDPPVAEIADTALAGLAENGADLPVLDAADLAELVAIAQASKPEARAVIRRARAALSKAKPGEGLALVDVSRTRAREERYREIVRRYGDRMRMSNAPPELQQEIDDAIGAGHG